MLNYSRLLENRLGSSKRIWMLAPIIPWESIIQNNTKEPIKGVTIIGKIVPNTIRPFRLFAKVLTLKATIKPNTITGGVTAKQNVSVNNNAL